MSRFLTFLFFVPIPHLFAQTSSRMASRGNPADGGGGHDADEREDAPTGVVSHTAFDGRSVTLTESQFHRLTHRLFDVDSTRIGLLMVLMATMAGVFRYWEHGGSLPTISNMESAMRRFGMAFENFNIDPSDPSQWAGISGSPWILFAIEAYRGSRG